MLNVLTAFPVEAAPLLERHAPWRERRGDGITLYEGEVMRLAVCGMGRDNAARATRLLAGCGPAAARWLNFGIAGSASFAPGALVRARRVSDRASGRAWTLDSAAETGLPAGTVETVAEAARDYAPGVVYDMEAVGWLAALDEAGNGATGRACCVKLISDGPDAPLESLDRGRIAQLIHGAKGDILNIVQLLVDRA